MLEKEEGFRELMQRASEGSEQAAWVLVDRYGEAILRAVRRALNTRLRSRFDSLDFVQLVWSSLFRARDKLKRFSSPEELVAYLVVMTRNKVVMEARRPQLAEKHIVGSDRSTDETSSRHWVDPSDDQPRPIDVAIAREQWTRMLQDQPAHCRRIIQLRLQGYSLKDIAETLNLARSTVQRFLKKLERRTGR